MTKYKLIFTLLLLCLGLGGCYENQEGKMMAELRKCTTITSPEIMEIKNKSTGETFEFECAPVGYNAQAIAQAKLSVSRSWAESNDRILQSLRGLENAPQN
jgi:hypothetical protein